MRFAACSAITSLSRTEDKLTRASICSYSDIWDCLKALINDSYVEVKISAVRMICNLALELQNRKQDDYAALMSKLVDITKHSDNNSLRQNALCAIKNFSYMCNKDTRAIIISKFDLKELYILLDDADVEIQVQSLCLYRNLLYRCTEDINEVLAVNDQIYNKLYEKLFSPNEDVMIQALYVCCNIANGNERHRMSFMEEKFLKRLGELLVIVYTGPH